MLLVAAGILLLLCSFRKEDEIRKDKLTLVVFISPTCPICQYYCYDLNKIQDSIGLSVVGIIPVNSYVKKSEITAFYKNYKPEFPLFMDKKNRYVKKYDPDITPEFYLVRNDSVLYRGAFNDKFLDIGKKKTVVQHHYIYEAIYSLERKLPYEIRTQPAGCIIPK
ncbi:MAG: hypothetical protein U0T77_06035 [Chitinophagales bacterium]